MSASPNSTTEQARELVQVKYWNPRLLETIVFRGCTAVSAQRFVGIGFPALSRLHYVLCICYGDVSYETIYTFYNPSYCLHKGALRSVVYLVAL